MQGMQGLADALHRALAQKGRGPGPGQLERFGMDDVQVDGPGECDGLVQVGARAAAVGSAGCGHVWMDDGASARARRLGGGRDITWRLFAQPSADSAASGSNN